MPGRHGFGRKAEQPTPLILQVLGGAVSAISGYKTMGLGVAPTYGGNHHAYTLQPHPQPQAYQLFWCSPGLRWV